MHLLTLLPFVSVAAAWPALFGLIGSDKKGHFHSHQQTFNPDTDPWEKFKVDMLKLEQYKYIPPGKDDVRSPCPWVSMCANHGIIPRSGKNVHLESLYRCSHFGGHSKTLYKTTRTTPIKTAKLYNEQDIAAHKPNPHALDRFDLPDTGFPPNKIGFLTEHDLSLTRFDLDFNFVNMARDAKPNRELVKGMLTLATKHKDCKQEVTDAWIDKVETGPVDKNCYLDLDDLVTWMKLRMKEEAKRHETLRRSILYGINEEFAATGEAVFLLELMGRKGKINLEHAKSFMWHEKIPDGWEPPSEMSFPMFLAKMVKVMGTYRWHGIRKGNMYKYKGDPFPAQDDKEYPLEELSDEKMGKMMLGDQFKPEMLAKESKEPASP